jgi:hypothetical protein
MTVHSDISQQKKTKSDQKNQIQKNQTKQETADFAAILSTSRGAEAGQDKHVFIHPCLSNFICMAQVCSLCVMVLSNPAKYNQTASKMNQLTT